MFYLLFVRMLPRNPRKSDEKLLNYNCECITRQCFDVTHYKFRGVTLLSEIFSPHNVPMKGKNCLFCGFHLLCAINRVYFWFIGPLKNVHFFHMLRVPISRPCLCKEKKLFIWWLCCETPSTAWGSRQCKVAGICYRINCTKASLSELVRSVQVTCVLLIHLVLPVSWMNCNVRQ